MSNQGMEPKEELKIILSKGQKPKEFIDGTEKVLYWDEYRYLNAVYRMEQLENTQTLLLGEILLELDISGLRGLSDLTKINPGLILHSLIKEKSIFKVLAILLKRVDGNNLLDTTEAEFIKGRTHNFKPFATEVWNDFFSLNSTLYSDIAEFWTVLSSAWQHLKKELFTNGKELMKSISSLTERPAKSKRSSKKGAATS